MPASPLSTLASPGTLLSASSLDEIAVAVRAARRHILITTPFMSLPVAQLLVKAAQASRASDLRLITAVTTACVSGGYLDPFAVDRFIDPGFDVQSLLNLHAKIVLTDDIWGLVGSGILTAAGVDGGNAELGVVLTRKQAKQARTDHFELWWADAKAVNQKAMHRMAKSHRPKNPRRQQHRGQGGYFEAPPGRELASFSKNPVNSRYWLKIMYGNPGLATKAGWRGFDWVSDAHVIRSGTPTHKPTYAIGDHLVIYVSKVERPACPAIQGGADWGRCQHSASRSTAVPAGTLGA